MVTLAGALAALIGGPVLDRTGLGGKYDFKLEYDPGSVNGRESGGKLSPDLLGVEMEVGVVDQVEQQAALAREADPALA